MNSAVVITFLLRTASSPGSPAWCRSICAADQFAVLIHLPCLSIYLLCLFICSAVSSAMLIICPADPSARLINSAHPFALLIYLSALLIYLLCLFICSAVSSAMLIICPADLSA
jgi:hypothetical protein